MKEFKINICGDFYVDCGSTTIQRNKDNLLASVTKLFAEAHVNIVNLEAPITVNEKKIIKTGPYLKQSLDISQMMVNSNINAVTLSNNHIMDYGAKGLIQTIQQLDMHSIKHVGAGLNSSEASRPLMLNKNGISCAIVNICENEWSISSENDAGSNPLEIIQNTKQIQSAKKVADYVIVIIHGGHEYYNLPSPRMVKQYRYFAEIGADIIVGHHPHCISGYEIHMNVPIFYSLGNFIFTKQSKNHSWYLGLILQLSIDNNKGIDWKLIPTRQSKIDSILEILPGDECATIFREVERLNNIIGNKDALLKAWVDYLHENREAHLQNISIISSIPNRYIRALLRKSGFINLLLSKRHRSYLLSYLRCEAHNDAAREILEAELINYKEN